jgi:hypothetical protein
VNEFIVPSLVDKNNKLEENTQILNREDSLDKSLDENNNNTENKDNTFEINQEINKN